MLNGTFTYVGLLAAIVEDPQNSDRYTLTDRDSHKDAVYSLLVFCVRTLRMLFSFSCDPVLLYSRSKDLGLTHVFHGLGIHRVLGVLCVGHTESVLE